MAQTGKVVRAFPYSDDGVNLQHLREGRVMSFPDKIYDGLKREGYVAASTDAPQNSVADAEARDAAIAGSDFDVRLMAAGDQELKDIIARSGTPISGNLVHADMVAQARAQLLRERDGAKPVMGVDPNSGVTEMPLAKPGEATPPSAAAAVTGVQVKSEADAKADAKAEEGDTKRAADAGKPAASPTNQFGEDLPERHKTKQAAVGKRGK